MMDPERSLGEKLGAVIHERAHRHGGGGIDCFDADLVGRHAPCYLIADELVDHIPSSSVHPGRNHADGYAQGAGDVAKHLEHWLSEIDVTGAGGRELRDRAIEKARTVAQRVRNGDPKWRQDEKFGRPRT